MANYFGQTKLLMFQQCRNIYLLTGTWFKKDCARYLINIKWLSFGMNMDGGIIIYRKCFLELDATNYWNNKGDFVQSNKT